jgi:exodeoxyribonuclease VII large subunit
LDDRLNASVVRRIGELRQRLNLLANQLRHAPGKGIFTAQQRLTALNNRLQRTMDASLSDQQQRLARLGATLQAAHPQRVLERGYSMVQDNKGGVISDIGSLTEGQTIQLQFADGQAAADVHTIQPLEEQP